ALAHDAIEYETVVFASSFGKSKTPYQGPPSPEVDELWNALYNAPRISRIPRLFQYSSLQRHRSHPWQRRSVAIFPTSGYIIGLNIFHEVHCLNNLRMLIWPEYYAEEIKRMGMHGKEMSDEERVGHLDHCIDTPRQSLMCQ
ncbi:hypothetical protein BDZ45DRAFT_584496, partial [Acephala macrosclerotiorum]